jgi:hypothetical protein
MDEDKVHPRFKNAYSLHQSAILFCLVTNHGMPGTSLLTNVSKFFGLAITVSISILIFGECEILDCGIDNK